MSTSLVHLPLPEQALYNILMRLSHQDIINVCQSDEELSYICEDNYFWAEKAYRDFDFPKNLFYSMRSVPDIRYLTAKSYFNNPYNTIIDAIMTNNYKLVEWILPLAKDNSFVLERKDSLKILEFAIRKKSKNIIDLLLTIPGYIGSLLSIIYDDVEYNNIENTIFILNNFYNLLYDADNGFFMDLIFIAIDNNYTDMTCQLVRFALENNISLDWIQTNQPEDWPIIIDCISKISS